MAEVAQISVNGPDGGSAHAIGIGDLRVMIIRDGESEWYAQGLDIDYIAQGASLKDVQQAFEAGLKKTIEEHLKLYGDITKLLQAAPPEVWKEFYEHVASYPFRYSNVSAHALSTPVPEEVTFVASTLDVAVRHAEDVPVRHAHRGLPHKRIAYLTPTYDQIPA